MAASSSTPSRKRQRIGQGLFRNQLEFSYKAHFQLKKVVNQSEKWHHLSEFQGGDPEVDKLRTQFQDWLHGKGDKPEGERTFAKFLASSNVECLESFYKLLGVPILQQDPAARTDPYRWLCGGGETKSNPRQIKGGETLELLSPTDESYYLVAHHGFDEVAFCSRVRQGFVVPHPERGFNTKEKFEVLIFRREPRQQVGSVWLRYTTSEEVAIKNPEQAYRGDIAYRFWARLPGKETGESFFGQCVSMVPIFSQRGSFHQFLALGAHPSSTGRYIVTNESQSFQKIIGNADSFDPSEVEDDADYHYKELLVAMYGGVVLIRVSNPEILAQHGTCEYYVKPCPNNPGYFVLSTDPTDNMGMLHSFPVSAEIREQYLDEADSDMGCQWQYAQILTHSSQQAVVRHVESVIPGRIEWLPIENQRTPKRLPLHLQMEEMTRAVEIMPSCIEKQLLMLSYVAVQLHENNELIPILSKKAMTLWKELNEILPRALDRFILPSTGIEDAMKSIDRFIAAHQWHKLRQCLEHVRREFTAFDLHEAVYLGERSKTVDHLGHSTVFLMGPVGCDKTALVDYLVGSTHTRAVARTGTSNPQVQSPPFAQTTVTGSSQSPFQSHRIDTLRLHCRIDGKEEVDLTLADMTGFEVAERPELELANIAAVVRAFSAANESRLVLLVSKDNLESNIQPLLSLFDALSYLLSSKDMPAIRYVITGFTKDTGRGKFIAKAESLIRLNLFRGGVAAFWDDMLQKAKEGKAYVLDPREPQPAELLLRIRATDSVSEPNGMFSFPPTQSVGALTKQLLTERIRIAEALKGNGAGWIDYISFKMRLLKSLASAWPTKEITDFISTICSDVQQSISRLVAEAKLRMRFLLQLEKLEKSELLELLRVSDHAYLLTMSLQTWLNVTVQEPFSAREVLLRAGKEIAQQIRAALHLSERTPPRLEREVQLQVQKLFLLSEEITELELDVQEVSTALQSHFETVKIQLEQHLQCNRVPTFARELSRLSALDLPDTLRDVANAAHNSLIAALKTRLFQIQDSATELFSQPGGDLLDTVSLETLRYARDAVRDLVDLKSCCTFGLMVGFSQEQIDADLLNLGSSLKMYLSALADTVCSRLAGVRNRESLESIHTAFMSLEFASAEIQLIQTSRYLQQVVQGILLFFQTVGQDVFTAVTNSDTPLSLGLSNMPTTFLSDDELRDKLRLLKECSWIDKQLPEFPKERQAILADLTECLGNSLREFEQTMKNKGAQLGQDHSLWLPHRLRSFSAIVSTFSELGIEHEHLSANVSQIVHRVSECIGEQDFGHFVLKDQLDWLSGKQRLFDAAQQKRELASRLLINHECSSIGEVLVLEANCKERQSRIQESFDLYNEQSNESLKTLQAEIQQVTKDGNDELQERLIEQRKELKASMQQNQQRFEADLASCNEEGIQLRNLQNELQALAAEDPQQVLNDAASERPDLLAEATKSCLDYKIAEITQLQRSDSGGLRHPASSCSSSLASGDLCATVIAFLTQRAMISMERVKVCPANAFDDLPIILPEEDSREFVHPVLIERSVVPDESGYPCLRILLNGELIGEISDDISPMMTLADARVVIQDQLVLEHPGWSFSRSNSVDQEAMMLVSSIAEEFGNIGGIPTLAIHLATPLRASLPPILLKEHSTKLPIGQVIPEAPHDELTLAVVRDLGKMQLGIDIKSFVKATGVPIGRPQETFSLAKLRIDNMLFVVQHPRT